MVVSLVLASLATTLNVAIEVQPYQIIIISSDRSFLCYEYDAPLALKLFGFSLSPYHSQTLKQSTNGTHPQQSL